MPVRALSTKAQDKETWFPNKRPKTLAFQNSTYQVDTNDRLSRVEFQPYIIVFRKKWLVRLPQTKTNKQSLSKLIAVLFAFEIVWIGDTSTSGQMI